MVHTDYDVSGGGPAYTFNNCNTSLTQEWTKMKDIKDRPIGLGTAAIGRPTYINLKQEASATEAFSLAAFKAAGIEVLNTAYENGLRYFDTAPGYGMAEQLLIEWAHGKNDPTIEVATKWGYTYVADFNPEATEHEVKEHSLAKLNEQWEQSKKLLPLLKGYQVHSATFDTGVLTNEAVLNRLSELKAEHGLLMGVTTSGDNQNEVLKAALEVEVNGEALFDLFQVTYNVFDQSLALIANEVAAQGKRLVIKEALANGRVFPNANYPNYAAAYQLLGRLAKQYGVGIDAIALRFCVDSIPVYKVLSGAASMEHITSNLSAEGFQLSAEDVAKIKKLAISPEKYWGERKRLGWN